MGSPTGKVWAYLAALITGRAERSTLVHAQRWHSWRGGQWSQAKRRRIERRTGRR